MRIRVGHRPKKGRGLGAGLVGDYRSCTREILLNLLTVQTTSNEHRLSVFGKCTWLMFSQPNYPSSITRLHEKEVFIIFILGELPGDPPF